MTIVPWATLNGSRTLAASALPDAPVMAEPTARKRFRRAARRA